MTTNMNEHHLHHVQHQQQQTSPSPRTANQQDIILIDVALNDDHTAAMKTTERHASEEKLFTTTTEGFQL